ncbi:hypothetical protein HOL34_02625 [bacterium]|nr:hypothetical protein [bacterium]MBT3903380.1 hypothetical protein [bacterium]MBT4577677.1 hypothetical protein [bacterium]MBT5345847.1 hypothetical protein [bacterium]MBT6130826.1 hypothetical protein [bacterium]
MNVFKISRVLLLSSLVAAPCTMKPVNWGYVALGAFNVVTYNAIHQLFHNQKRVEQGKSNLSLLPKFFAFGYANRVILSGALGPECFVSSGLSIAALSAISYLAKTYGKTDKMKTFGKRLWTSNSFAAKLFAIGSPLLFAKPIIKIIIAKNAIRNSVSLSFGQGKRKVYQIGL